MSEETKKRDLFPDFEYRYFPIIFKETEMEGIQGPIYRPSGQILDLGNTNIVGMEAPTEVFHDGEAKMYSLSQEEFDLEASTGKTPEILGYIPCPACDTPIPITTNERPLKIKCPSCGKKGKLE
ncbi:MAG: hypothetical protein JXA22_10750 [Candidatus Thermoplasmatota archaeon]|nr:hypothetical protein [Candidatus Thermoplasmatota archaeon]